MCFLSRVVVRADDKRHPLAEKEQDAKSLFRVAKESSGASVAGQLQGFPYNIMTSSILRKKVFGWHLGYMDATKG